jgi:hypothetical protein
LLIKEPKESRAEKRRIYQQIQKSKNQIYGKKRRCLLIKKPKYQRAENRRSQNAKGANTKEPKKQATEGGTKIKEPKKQEPKEATQPLCPNFNNKMNLSSRAYPFKPD